MKRYTVHTRDPNRGFWRCDGRITGTTDRAAKRNAAFAYGLKMGNYGDAARDVRMEWEIREIHPEPKDWYNKETGTEGETYFLDRDLNVIAVVQPNRRVN
jgi:hypothetical protein